MHLFFHFQIWKENFAICEHTKMRLYNKNINHDDFILQVINVERYKNIHVNKSFNVWTPAAAMTGAAAETAVWEVQVLGASVAKLRQPSMRQMNQFQNPAFRIIPDHWLPEHCS